MSKFYKLIPFLVPFYLYSPESRAVLDVVITSAARTEQTSLKTPASITVITKEEIEASGAQNLVDVLRGESSIQILSNYGTDSRTSVSMRGFGETANANTLVLVNGRRLNNPDIASPDFNSISVEDIERIEIVNGSAGVLFGDQAVGGVINIITKSSGMNRHSVKVTGGSYDTRKVQAISSSSITSDLDYHISAEARKSDNYRDDNEANYKNVLARLDQQYDNGSVFGEIQYVDDELQTPGTLFSDEVAQDRRQANPVFADDFSNLESDIGRVGIEHRLSEDWSVESEVAHRDVDGVFRLSSVFGAETENSTQNREVTEVTPRLIGTIEALNNTLVTFGIDVIHSNYMLSSRFGDQFNDQSQQSIYVQTVTPVTESLELTIGARRAEVENNLRDTGTFATYPSGQPVDDAVTVGSLGIAWSFKEHWRYLFRLDQNYRFAKVDEYMSPLFTPSFEPVILETQEGLSVETGIEWRSNGNSAGLLIYQLELDDEIAFDPVSFANINIDETRRTGAVIDGRARLSEKLDVSASISFIDAEVEQGAFTGKDIPMVAEKSGSISIIYRSSENLQYFGEIQAVDDRPFSGDFDNVLGRLPGYAVVNLKVEYTLETFSVTARANNVLDKQYSEVGQLGTDPVTFASREAFFPSPERNFMLSAEWKLQ